MHANTIVPVTFLVASLVFLSGAAYAISMEWDALKLYLGTPRGQTTWREGYSQKFRAPVFALVAGIFSIAPYFSLARGEFVLDPLMPVFIGIAMYGSVATLIASLLTLYFCHKQAKAHAGYSIP